MFALMVWGWVWVGVAAYLRVAVGRLVIGDARAVARGGVADAAVRAVRVLLATLPPRRKRERGVGERSEWSREAVEGTLVE